MRMTKIFAVATLFALFSWDSATQIVIEPNAIFPKGNKGSSEYFTGNVWVNVLASTDSIFNTQIGSVTFEGAVKLANAYPNTPLLLHHWGSVDAPDFPPFNGDPQRLLSHVVNPERVHILAPGEPFTLKRLKKN